jgi:hypothetical protein
MAQQAPPDMAHVESAPSKIKPRNVFVYFNSRGQSARAGRRHGLDRAVEHMLKS